MTGTTPGGLPYPEGTDLVRDGDNAIRALAEAIDPRLPFGIATGQTSHAGGANETRVVTVTYPAGRFTVTPEVMATSRTATANSSTTNTEVWTQSPSTTGVQIAVNRSNTTAIICSWLAIQPTYAGGPAAFAALAADDGMLLPAEVTCHTSGCENEDITLVMDLGWTDENGDVQRVGAVQCGPCGQPITDIVDLAPTTPDE